MFCFWPFGALTFCFFEAMNLSKRYPTLASIYVKRMTLFELSENSRFVSRKKNEEQCSAFLTEQLRIVKVPKQLGKK